MKPIAVDLFSGPGGISEGLRAAGFDVRLAIDCDLNSYMVYTANHPGTPVLWQDVRMLKSLESSIRAIGLRKRDVALVAGGPPCQGFSQANRRTNSTDNVHNGMIEQFLRFVREIKPSAVLLENVEGLRSFNKGLVIDRVVRQLEKVGYDVEIAVLNSADYGVPQIRRRVFVIGSMNGRFRWPRKTHGPETSKPWVTVGDAILGDLPPLNGSIGERRTVYAGPPTSTYQKSMRQRRSVLYDHVTTASSERTKKRFSIVPQGSGLFYLEREGKVPKDLRIRIGHKGVYRRLDPDSPSLTVTNVSRSMTIHPEENRIISLREAARLQSFPDGYRFHGNISKMQQAIADAAPPNLVRAVALSLSKSFN
jgi:DNA (cytosine-5)-methyltransferase 1